MSRILFLGCGFLGEAAAELFSAAGREVLVATSSDSSGADFERRGWKHFVCDVSSKSGVMELQSATGPVDIWIHCASSGGRGVDGYRSVFLNGCTNLLSAYPGTPGIFTSSTSVYAQTGGEEVSESSPAEPSSETGKILRETEDLLLNSGGIVARLAGIYGPGRSVLLRKALEGSAIIEGDGGKWINQIHRDDGASALLALARSACRSDSAARGGIFNVSDDCPYQQQDFYRILCNGLGLKTPPHGERDMGKKRGWSNKRVLNIKMRQLGWAPRYPDYFSALPSLLSPQTGTSTQVNILSKEECGNDKSSGHG